MSEATPAVTETTSAAPAVTATTTPAVTSTATTTQTEAPSILADIAKPGATPAKTDTANYVGTYRTKEEAEAGIAKLNEIARSKGLQQTPEAYDFASIEKDHAIVFADDAQRAEVSKVLKDAGLSQEAMSKVAPLATQIATQARTDLMKEYGPVPDFSNERSALVAAWGDSAKAKADALTPFLQTLPPALRRAAETAEGAIWLDKYRESVTGADLATDTATTSGPSEADIRAEMSKISNDPNWRRSGPAQDQLAQQHNALAQQLVALRKR